MNDIYYPVAHRSQSEIDSFKTRYQDFDTKLIPTILKKSLSLTTLSWKPSNSWGSSHVIYNVETKERGRLILRANTGFNPEPEFAMLAEKLITDAVRAARVPTATIEFVDISRKLFPFDYQIETVLPGLDPEIFFKGSQDEYDQISFDLGAKVAMFHRLTFAGFGRPDINSISQNSIKGNKNSNFDYITTCLESDLNHLVIEKVLTKNRSKLISKLFDNNQELINIKQGVLVHHDLADHNITFIGNKVASIFDWETAVISDPILDLASCPTWKTIYPREHKLLEGYQSITPLPNHFIEKKNLYVLRTMLWKMVYSIRAKILNKDRIAKFTNSLTPFKI